MNKPDSADETEAQRVGREITLQSTNEQSGLRRLLAIAEKLLPKYGPEWNVHSLLTLRRQSISRVLYYNDLYQKIVQIPGVICEFGVQWGATLATLINLRGIHEPYNHSRRLFGFDTFSGFATIVEKDGSHVSTGDYQTMDNYEGLLEETLALHESFSPLAHIKKFSLIKGDVSVTIDRWLLDNPHAIISMAIFDMDVYTPTRSVLEKIIPRLTKGSVLIFDELNCPHFPGETRAVDEVLKINSLSLKHNPHQPFCAWTVWGE